MTKATLADAFAIALRRSGLTVTKIAAAARRRDDDDREPRERLGHRPERELIVERIPILKMGEYLLVTIQVDMHDRLAMTLQDDLTVADRQRRARKGVLIDISALEMVDSFIGRMLGDIAAMSRVLDAETVVVGMRPAVAITLVELGLSLTGVRTALNIERGMDLLPQAHHGERARGCRSCLASSGRSRRPRTSSACARRCGSGRWSSGSTSSIRRRS